MTKSKLILCDEEKLIKEEKERLRKLRLIQVREISKQNAALVRDAFRKEKEKETRNFLSKSEVFPADLLSNLQPNHLTISFF